MSRRVGLVLACALVSSPVLAADEGLAEKKLDEWGLKTPSLKAVITLTKDDKPKTFEYDFGKTDEKSGTYLRISGQDTISIVGNNVMVP